MKLEYTTFLDGLVTDKISSLSATTVALCLSTLSYAQNRWFWLDNGDAVDDATWDDIDHMVSRANEEIMSSLVGLIMPHALASLTGLSLLACDGSTHLKSDYPLLYDALDTTYILNGTQFKVPDLRDNVPVGSGNNYNLDDSGGVDNVTLDVSQIPSHRHLYDKPVVGIDVEGVGIPDPLAISNPMLPTLTSATGGGNSHENRMPYLAVNYAIVSG